MSTYLISKMDETTDSSISMETAPHESQNTTLQIRKQATIADLPEICLDEIISNCHIKDLIEVAKTNLALRQSAIRVFRLKYGKKSFEIKYGNERDMARMIIHFGPQISKIILRFHAADIHSVGNIKRKLLEMIIEECSPTLEELTISETYELPLCTPFPNLQTMNYSIKVRHDIHSTWFQINQWFPKLRKITVSNYDGRGYFNEYLVNQHMPNIDEMWLFSKSTMRISIPMAQLINRNRHIKSLRMAMEFGRDDGTEQFQREISWENLNVSKLDVRQEGTSPIIHFENVGKLKNLKSLAISADVYPNIDGFCFPLEELLVETGGQNETTIDFIVNHKLLERLSIKVGGGLGLSQSKRIAEHLKNLTDISFDVRNFEHPNAPDFLDGLIEFIRYCKALKTITVRYIPDEEIPKDDDKIKQIRKMYTDLRGEMGKISVPNRWKLCYECKALDIEFYHHNLLRFLEALQASKHAYIFKFVNEI